MAMESIAVMDVINAIDGSPTYLVNLTPPANVSTAAAVAAAAHQVLIHLYPGQAKALDAALARTDSAALWLSRSNPLHPSVLLRPHCSNLAAIWQAIDACAAVPAPVCQAIGSTLIVWRLGLRPQFRTLAANEAQFIRRLADGQSINQACADLAGTATLSDPQQLGLWLRDWLDQGVLRAA